MQTADCRLQRASRVAKLLSFLLMWTVQTCRREQEHDRRKDAKIPTGMGGPANRVTGAGIHRLMQSRRVCSFESHLALCDKS